MIVTLKKTYGLLAWAIVASLWIPSSHLKGESFIPRFENPVSEDFNWRIIERLGDLQMHCMTVDRDGVVWLGLTDGLASYDGLEVKRYGEESGIRKGKPISLLATRTGEIYFFQDFRVYRHYEGSWHVVYEGHVNELTMEIAKEAADGTVWVAARRGLLQINAGKVVLHRGFDEKLAAAFEDQLGYIWTAVLDDGKTYRIPVENGLLAPAERWEEMLPSNASSTSRYSFVQAPDGLIWRFSTDPDDPARFFDSRSEEWGELDFGEFGGSNQVQASYVTRDGAVWTVSDGVLHGMIDGEWRVHRNLSSRHGQMRANFSESATGDLWLLDYRTNLYRIYYDGKLWDQLEGLLFQLESRSGERWFVSEGGRVIRNHGQSFDEWESYGPGNGLIEKVNGISELSDGSLWALGSHEGVAALSIRDDDQWRLLKYPKFGDSLRAGSLVEMPSGMVAVCSRNFQDWIDRRVSGVLLLESDGQVSEYGLFPRGEVHSRVVDLSLDDEGRLIAVSGFQMHRFEEGVWEELDLPSQIEGFWIDDLAVDEEGSFWIASWGYGVAMWSKEGSVISFAQQDGLPSRFVSGILEDPNSGDMFALTSEGLARFDGKGWFPVGGASKLTNHRSASMLRPGEDGAIWVTQANMPWYERSFKEYGYRKPDGEKFRSLLYQPDKDEPETYLEVLHDPRASDRGLSVEWSARDKWNESLVNDLRYSFRLDGGEWSEFVADRKRSFHQLDDGDHVLEVRARDQSFNVDSTPANYAFNIPPPVWKRGWFIALIGITVASFAVLVAIIFRLRWRHLIEYDEQRINFFTNISHELRTPLSLILSPLEKAADKTRDLDRQRDLKLALKNARRLNQLVDQLLDFRKIESNAMECELVTVDIVAQLREISESFSPLAEEKRQDLSFRCLEDARFVRYDSEKLHKVVANLVSNAVKYTPFGGRVRATLEFDSKIDSRRDWAVIRVEDDGRGISESMQKHVFEPFYRGDSVAAHEVTGTGLGLSLSKQLVDLLGGSIEVESPIVEHGDEKTGTRFSVKIPIEKAEIPEADETLSIREESYVPATNEIRNEEPKELRILLVDDNEDLLDFLSRDLSERYEVMTAENGEEALLLAREKIPDLVIADVMMPKMNGIDFCRELKASVSTSHIPVIMLTARSSSHFEELGLESGADEYLTKPISMVKLDLRIHNLLETRSKLQSRLTSQFLSNPGNLVVENSEQAFLKKVVDSLEERLSDPDFGVDELAEKMGQSRSSFYRKLKAISDETPQGFIRRYRMKRAGQLLLDTKMSVTEIMYEIGYSDIGYFGKLFKTHFECSPTEYRQGAGRTSIN